MLHQPPSDLVREACYEVLRIRFGWVDDDIAVQITGG
jgi:hypothetical protein